MKPGHASRTAEYMALFRALESALPADRRLFEDPLARTFLSPPLAVVAWLAGFPVLRDVLPRIIDRRWPGARSSAVARTRLIDDTVRAALDAGAEQIVLLGAGFDARGYRLPGMETRAVFEVDHPATLARKQAVLRRVLPELLRYVRFVPTDFNQRQLESAMAAAGYRESARTLFLWEGVTNYLSEAAVDSTLCWCARSAPGSQVVFTYVHRAVLDHPQSFAGTAELFATLAAAGETWTFGLDPADLPEFLRQRGLLLERDTGAAEYRRVYFHEAAREMLGYEFYRIAAARVPDRRV